MPRFPLLALLVLLPAVPLAAGGQVTVSHQADLLRAGTTSPLDARFFGDHPPGVTATAPLEDHVNAGLHVAWVPFPGRPDRGFLRGLDLAITGTYRPESRMDLHAKAHLRSDGAVDIPSGSLVVAYGALGAQVTWRRFFEFGLSLEVRRERLEMDVPGRSLVLRTSLTRPWAGITVGYTMRLEGRFVPVFSLGISGPLTQTRAPHPGDSSPDRDLRVLKAMAPECQYHARAGVRFGGGRPAR